MDDRPVLLMQEDPECWFTPCRIPAGAEIAASVIIPNYCAEATLLRAVHSVLTQSRRDIEVIVIDDASTDQSWEMIRDLLPRDERIRAVRHKANRGKPTAMNRGIALARGRWLAVLDADDWYHADRLAALIALGERHQADMVSDNQFLYDAPAARVVGTAWPERVAAWPLDFDDFLRGSNAYDTFNLGMLKPVIRLDFMHRVGLGYEVEARHGQDFFHLLQFYLSGGRAVVSDQPLYFYTQPFGRISRQWSHRTRKRYDFHNAYRINDRYLKQAMTVLPPRQWKRLQARNNRLHLLENYFQAREALGRGDYIGAIGLVARHPAMLGYVLARIAERAKHHPGYYATIKHIALRSSRRAAKGGTDAGQYGRQ
jgi:succinoglycan biosynthesis protein ExoO